LSHVIPHSQTVEAICPRLVQRNWIYVKQNLMARADRP
jgi:hypothetical protein